MRSSMQASMQASMRSSMRSNAGSVMGAASMDEMTGLELQVSQRLLVYLSTISPVSHRVCV
jgi:hypothetical protein